jgi:hypothetical protein
LPASASVKDRVIVVRASTFTVIQVGIAPGMGGESIRCHR